MDFPQYRKYSTGTSFFKIISGNEFEELQKVGSSFRLHKVHAKTYPEKLRIMDMLNCTDSLWKKIEEKEYQEVFV